MVAFLSVYREAQMLIKVRLAHKFSITLPAILVNSETFSVSDLLKSSHESTFVSVKMEKHQ